MKHSAHRQKAETRSEVLFRFADQQMHEKRCSWETFAARAVEWYSANVAPEARSVREFKTEGDAFACAKINAQRLKRWRNPELNTRLPADFEEAWVNGLDEPYRTECKRELARRYGFLAAPIPHDALTVSDGLQCMSALSDEFGGALKDLAAIVSDGRVDSADRENAAHAAKRLEGLIGVAIGLKEQLSRV